MRKQKNRIDDPLWKAVLEDTFRYFLEYFFVHVEEVLDLDAEFQFLSHELQVLDQPQGHNKGLRLVDKLVKVKRKDGGEQFVICHIEVQSSKSKVPLEQRMFEYYYRIYEKYKLPITAIVILTDNKLGYNPQIFVQEFLGTQLHYRFNTFKILEQNEEELRANPNPFAVVVLTALLALKHKNITDEELKNIKIDLVKEMQKRQMPEKTRHAILDFLTRYVSFENTEILTTFEKEITESFKINNTMGTREYLLEKARTEGIMQGIAEERKKARLEKAEGISKGRAEEREKALAEKKAIALEFKKLGVPSHKIAAITGVPVDEL